MRKKDLKKKNLFHKKKESSFLNNLKRRFVKVKEALFDELEDDESNKAIFNIFEVLLIIVVSILFGVVLGCILMYSRNPITGMKSDKKVSEIVSTYNKIISSYYGEVDKDKLVDSAVRGMIESLNDPYSNFMDYDTTSNFNESTDGSFVGIGVVVQFDGTYNKILSVNEKSPAEKSGLKAEDVIIKVDGKDVKGKYGTDISKYIRGKMGTKVKITVNRNGKTKDFIVKRDVIELDVVSSQLIEHNNSKVGYIKIDSFALNSYKQFRSQLLKLEKEKIESLIIDVRGNPGGHLLQTKQILSMFFPYNTVLYQIQSKDGKKKVYSDTREKRTYPVVILIDEGSASASEILISCFKENYKDIVIVGKKSYGKGSVQKSESLSSGSSIKITTEKWLTSKGKWLNQKGIKPDFDVNQSEQYYQDYNSDYDVQLQEALNHIKES